MKKLVSVLFLLSFLIPLRADELLTNPDFTDGISHWNGDGESVAVSNDSSAAPSVSQSVPGANTGLIVKLHSTEWTKVTQDFRPLVPRGRLTITYKLSDDFAFSTNRKDYRNVSKRIDYIAFKRFPLRPGEWLAAVVELEGRKRGHGRLLVYPMVPRPGPDPQTVTAEVVGMGIDDDRIVCLAFPPGTGSITLLHVGLEGR